MTIGITGATGNVGSRAVRLLIQAGERPRVLVRDPGRLDPGLAGLVDVARGDLLDPDFVETATDGLDALLWITPENFTAEDPLAEMGAMAAAGAAAVKTRGVRRVVLISSVGAERRTGAGLIDGLARAEEEFAATGVDLAILRNGYYFTNLLGNLDELRNGRLSTTMPADRAMSWVDPRDVGDVAAARLLAGGWSGTVVQAVHGPADLTWAQVTAIVGAAIGREVELDVIGDDVMRAGLAQAGLSAPAVDGLVGMIAGQRDGFTPEQARTAVTTTPTTLASWTTDVLAPALAG
ncbi:NAD(P)H-binding protein [Actinoplanes sp. DH11]|uniref:NAD(P)H-binding protein n=1 Tax=Actinoplanes sp. DH11 TaxID=2857011 RepID=UPI001E439564|nr:NAD(P)H-binding protein [Actinoplanes sp. DH11]